MIDVGIITMDSSSDMFKRCYNSIIERTNKSIPYQIFVQESKERETVNFNRLVSQFENRFVVYVNDDVEIIDADWLLFLYSLCRLKRIALVGCAEVYTQLDKMMYLADSKKIIVATSDVEAGLILDVPWVASYCWMWDRSKVELWFDEDIPVNSLCGKGMADVDACIAVRESGFLVMKDYRFRVYHEHKQETEEQHKARMSIYQDQVAYMKRKWGSEKFNQYYTGGVKFFE